jgi:hypothetical protein
MNKEEPALKEVKEAIELFVVRHFDNIEMAGSVIALKVDDINYISIDLKEAKLDEGIDKLHKSLSDYLKEWGKINLSGFIDNISISRLTIEYLLPEKEGANQNVSKHFELFNVPSYYYRSSQNSEKAYSKVFLVFLNFWYNLLYRNTAITVILTLVLISLYNSNPEFNIKLEKSYGYINLASGIIASFVLGFLINKVGAIRQDKLNYTRKIISLSNKLTYFRKVCYNLVRDHHFWSEEKHFYTSYQYANSIKNKITFEEYYYPKFDDKVKYAKFKSFYKEDEHHIHSVVSLILQMQMMADDEFSDSGLSYTEFPPNYIYSHEELNRFITFSESNLIWYCNSEMKIFSKTFYKSLYIGQIIQEINRIYPQDQIEELTSNKLEEVSLDFQYRIIPKLYKLTKHVNSGLPITVKYFMWAFILLISFGTIVPTLTYIFINSNYAFMSVFVVIGIIVHILLTLIPILRAENTLDKNYDYL